MNSCMHADMHKQAHPSHTCIHVQALHTRRDTEVHTYSRPKVQSGLDTLIMKVKFMSNTILFMEIISTWSLLSITNIKIMNIYTRLRKNYGIFFFLFSFLLVGRGVMLLGTWIASVRSTKTGMKNMSRPRTWYDEGSILQIA